MLWVMILINKPHIIFSFFPSRQQDCTDVKAGMHNTTFSFVIFDANYSLGDG